MIAFIFSGQGAQKVGMGQELFDQSKAVRDVFTTVSNAIGMDMEELCFHSEADKLNQTIYTQSAVFTMDCAMMAAIMEAGIAPEACAGFSLGEYAALVCANILPLAEVAKLVQVRAEAMNAVQQGSMMAVLGMDSQELQQLCEEMDEGYVIPVNYNCPGQIVVAGEENALEALRAKLKGKKKKAIPLKVSGAFHSKFMEPASKELTKSLENVIFQSQTIPLICNVTAKELDENDNWVNMLAKQCCSSVRWEDSIRELMNIGVDTFIECGPGTVLSGFNKKITPESKLFSVEDSASLATCLFDLKS